MAFLGRFKAYPKSLNTETQCCRLLGLHRLVSKPIPKALILKPLPPRLMRTSARFKAYPKSLNTETLLPPHQKTAF